MGLGGDFFPLISGDRGVISKSPVYRSGGGPALGDGPQDDTQNGSGVVAVRYADTCRFADADAPGQAFEVGGGVLKGGSDC